MNFHLEFIQTDALASHSFGDTMVSTCVFKVVHAKTSACCAGCSCSKQCVLSTCREDDWIHFSIHIRTLGRYPANVPAAMFACDEIDIVKVCKHACSHG